MVGRESVIKTEQIRQACDVVDVISSYVTLRRAGKDWRGLCPFHSEKTPSFYVVPDKQIFKCFGCGAGGDVFKFLQMKEGVDFVEAREILALRAGIALEQDRATHPSDGPTASELERVNRWACRWFQQQLQRPEAQIAQRYVAGRGIHKETIQRFSLGYAPDDWQSLCRAAEAGRIDRELLSQLGLIKKRPDGSAYDAFRNRLIFPIRDAMSRIIGFGGRTLGDDPAKYLNSPKSRLFDKGRCLYGVDTAKESLSKQRTAILVEGYIDCILVQQAGYHNTLATLGTALTADHTKVLRRYVDSVVLVFDSDEAGQRAADRSIGIIMTEKLDVRLAYVPNGKDPAEMILAEGPASFKAVLTSATDALEYKWQQVRHRFRNAETGSDRRRAIEEFLSLVIRCTDFGTMDPIQRGLILNQVGKLLGLSSEEVRRQLGLIARRSAPAQRNDSAITPGNVLQVRDAATAAMKQLLEVLINEPAFWPAVESEFDTEMIVDAPLRDIACVVADLARQGESFNVSGIISRFDSVQKAGLITDLQIAGEQRGNYADTVEGAIRRLKAIQERRRVGELMEGFKQRQSTLQNDPSGEKHSDEPASQFDENDHEVVRAIGDVVRKTSHFAARRHLASMDNRGH